MRLKSNFFQLKLSNNATWLICLTIAYLIIFAYAERAVAVNQIEEIKVAIDNFWILFSSILVVFMNCGFALLESGFCRAKNTVNILFKNLLVLAIATVSYFCFGFGFSYGDGNGIIGFSGFFLNGADNSPAIGENYHGVYSALSWASISLSAKFLYQVALAATAATVISGAVAERIRLISYLVFCSILISLIYPLIVHSVWGFGFLHRLGFYDFGGATVVHSVGGWCALVGCLLLGERAEKYQNGQSVPLVGHSLPLATLGCFILWLGWFGLNMGSTLNLSTEIGNIALNTLLSSCAAAISATIVSWFLFTKPDLSLVINAILAGLVAITASVNCVGYAIALLIGAIAGVLVVVSILTLERLKIDDPVGALSVHLVNGIWGTIAVGLFASPSTYRGTELQHFGLFFGGGFTQLIEQLFGILVVGTMTMVLSYLSWSAIAKVFGLRVTLTAEKEGLDVSEHGMEAYSNFSSNPNNIVSAYQQDNEGKSQPENQSDNSVIII